MHLRLSTEPFLRALELVGRVSTKHVTLPVLQCVVIEARDQRVVLKATNLEIGIEVALEAMVEEVGLVAVPAATLLQTISLHDQREVILRLEEDTLIVEGVRSTTQIKSIAAEDFPHIPRLTTSAQKIQGNVFALGLKTVAFAASQSSIKPELGSVLVTQKKEHTLTFVATDSFRLMEKTVSQQHLVLDESLLIPYKNALELTRIIETVKEEVSFQVSENQCAFTFANGVYVTSRLIAGSFPDYVQIIPKEYCTHSTVLRHDLSHALKKTNIFLNKFFQVSVIVTESSVTISANSGDVGTTTESIKATTTGDELTLSFNQRYIVEPLTYFADESIMLHFAGIGRPLVMESAHDKSIRYLVMPMNK
jgi:DNA polymerase-3 subunit beta